MVHSIFCTAANLQLTAFATVHSPGGLGTDVSASLFVLVVCRHTVYSESLLFIVDSRNSVLDSHTVYFKWFVYFGVVDGS